MDTNDEISHRRSPFLNYENENSTHYHSFEEENQWESPKRRYSREYENGNNRSCTPDFLPKVGSDLKHYRNGSGSSEEKRKKNDYYNYDNVQKEKSIQSKAQMPAHMMMIDSKSQNDESQKATLFYDINDCYSDMDEDIDVFQQYSAPPSPIVPNNPPMIDLNRWQPIDIVDDFPNDKLMVSPLSGRINKDYLDMARLYRLQRPYSDKDRSQSCVLCFKRKASHVFFPCDHCCVCEECIKSEEICPDSKLSSKIHGCCNCSICGEIIKKILPFEHGIELEKYWSWLYEYNPPLPEGFMKNFKHCAGVIEAVHVNHDDDNDSNASTSSGASCVVS